MAYVAKRLLLAVPTLLVVSLVVFLALRMAPGDPAQTIAGIDAPPDVVDQIRHELGLDRSLPEQYTRFLWGILHLDLGRSTISRLPVVAELEGRVGPSIVLAAGACALAALIGVLLGVISATRRRSRVDYGIVAVATVGLAVPAYVLGLLLILLFAVELRWLPATGADGLVNYVLPVLTLGLSGAAVVTRQTRGAALEVMRQDFVRTARAKGLGEVVVVGRHVLRNALAPVITVIGYQFGALLGGLVIVEMIFAIPGIGGLIVERILARDYPVVQGGILVLTMTTVLVNLVVDLAYAAADPRIRFA